MFIVLVLLCLLQSIYEIPYRQAASMSSLLLPSLSPRKKAPTDPARAPNRELLTTRPDLKGLRLYLHSHTHTHTQHAQCHACQACVTMQQSSLEPKGQIKAIPVG